MDTIFRKIQQTYQFSDYQISILRYMILGTLSDSSKMVFLFLLFHKLSLLLPFLSALIPFLLLRQLTGGLHCKTYLGCLLATVSYFLTITILIPHFLLFERPVRLLLLLVCALSEYHLGPILSNRELHISGKVTRIKKGAVLLLIVLYLLLDIFLPAEPYHLYGIYAIYLHAVQLIYTKILKEVKQNHA